MDSNPGENLDKLTPSQERFCVLYTAPDRNGKTRPAYKAYMQAFSRCKSAKHAMNASSDLLKNKAVKARIAELRETVRAAFLEDSLPFTLLVNRIVQGIDAIAVKTANHEGKICDEKAYIDFPTRERYIRLALELRGDLHAEKHDGVAASVGKSIIGIVDDIRKRSRPAGAADEPETGGQSQPGV